MKGEDNTSTSTATKGRIMLVDDEPDINAALRVVLTRGGFEIDTFEYPLIALGKLRPGFYDLIILDVKMPLMDGFELYQEIKKVDKKAKICFLTASELYYESFRQEKFSVLDKDLFIRKPISNAELLKRINSILKGPDTYSRGAEKNINQCDKDKQVGNASQGHKNS